MHEYSKQQLEMLEEFKDALEKRHLTKDHLSRDHLSENKVNYFRV